MGDRQQAIVFHRALSVKYALHQNGLAIAILRASLLRDLFLIKNEVEVKLKLKTLIAGLFREESYRDLLENITRKKTEKDLVFNSCFFGPRRASLFHGSSGFSLANGNVFVSLRPPFL